MTTPQQSVRAAIGNAVSGASAGIFAVQFLAALSEVQTFTSALMQLDKVGANVELAHGWYFYMAFHAVRALLCTMLALVGVLIAIFGQMIRRS